MVARKTSLWARKLNISNRKQWFCGGGMCRVRFQIVTSLTENGFWRFRTSNTFLTITYGRIFHRWIRFKDNLNEINICVILFLFWLVLLNDSCKHKWFWIINLTIENSLFWINFVCGTKFVELIIISFNKCPGLACRSSGLFLLCRWHLVRIISNLLSNNFEYCGSPRTAFKSWNLVTIKDCYHLRLKLKCKGTSGIEEMNICWHERRCFLNVLSRCVALGPRALICWVSQGFG